MADADTKELLLRKHSRILLDKQNRTHLQTEGTFGIPPNIFAPGQDGTLMPSRPEAGIPFNQ